MSSLPLVPDGNAVSWFQVQLADFFFQVLHPPHSLSLAGTEAVPLRPSPLRSLACPACFSVAGFSPAVLRVSWCPGGWGRGGSGSRQLQAYFFPGW